MGIKPTAGDKQLPTKNKVRSALEKLHAEAETEVGAGVYHTLLMAYIRGDLTSNQVEKALERLKEHAEADYLTAVPYLVTLKYRLQQDEEQQRWQR